MALKYALHPYGSLPGNAGNFTVYDVDLNYSYPTSIEQLITDGGGQQQPIFDKYIPCVLVYKDIFTVGHETIINNAWTAWDIANPTNIKPVEMKVIFTEAEFDNGDVFQQVEDKIVALIAALP